MKTCCRCKKTSEVVAFTTNKRALDGLNYHCNECRNIHLRQTYLKNPRKFLTRNKNWALKNPEKARKSHFEATDRYALNNKVIRNANVAVREALKRNKLTRKPCSICGQKAHAHHSDYSKPLDVVWFCPSHHKAWHRIFIPEIPVLGD